LAGGVNLYAYAGNNPTAFTDPFGLCPPEKTGKPCGLVQGLKVLASNFVKGFSSVAAGGVTNFEDTGPGARSGGIVATVLFPLMAPTTTRIGAAVGTRYMGAAEAAGVDATRVIPATNAAGRARVIHYTTDAPTVSAAEAQAKYLLPETPTHMCQFPLCNVLDDVKPTGKVAPGATQRATSQPINSAGRPVPLDL
jgi:hypothetical protein